MLEISPTRKERTASQGFQLFDTFLYVLHRCAVYALFWKWHLVESGPKGSLRCLLSYLLCISLGAYWSQYLKSDALKSVQKT